VREPLFGKISKKLRSARVVSKAFDPRNASLVSYALRGVKGWVCGGRLGGGSSQAVLPRRKEVFSGTYVLADDTRWNDSIRRMRGRRGGGGGTNFFLPGVSGGNCKGQGG